MAIDTPARLAVLGAGPIGLEAALYARFLGYDVAIYERGEVAENVRRWGHVRLFTPFGLNRSPLGLAALEAQDDAYRPPSDDALLTGRQWIEQYLAPLAQTDLLADHLRLHTTVLAVGREELLKGDLPGHADRGDWSFRILSRSDAGEERIDSFDGVLDCTGVFGQANWLGHGGIPAVGERALAERIEYRLPDVLGADRARYAGRHTLLVGAGASAATNAVALGELAAAAPGTRVTWCTRREGAAGAGGPIAALADDRLPQRAELARRANALATGGGAFDYRPRTVVERIAASGAGPLAAGAFEVELAGEHAGVVTVDEIIANVGFRPDTRLTEELQIHECYASQGPMKLAAALQQHAAADCLDQTAHGAAALLNPEPNYYVLGHKSYGRQPQFLLQVGCEQIREAFTLIGDRPSLNLYATAIRLPR